MPWTLLSARPTPAVVLVFGIVGLFIALMSRRKLIAERALSPPGGRLDRGDPASAAQGHSWGSIRCSCCHDEVMEKHLWNRRTALLLIATASLAVLFGCSAQPSDSVTAFDRPQAETDKLPSGPADSIPDSSRLLFEEESARYFASESSVDGEVCLTVHASNDAWVQSCSTSLPITLFVDGGREAQLNAESDFPSSDEWDQVADNLALKK